MKRVLLSIVFACALFAPVSAQTRVPHIGQPVTKWMDAFTDADGKECVVFESNSFTVFADGRIGVNLSNQLEAGSVVNTETVIQAWVPADDPNAKEFLSVLLLAKAKGQVTVIAEFVGGADPTGDFANFDHRYRIRSVGVN